MAAINIELCPETGICSLRRADGTKTDLMPDEVAALRAGGGAADSVRARIADADEAFAKTLEGDELAQIAKTLIKPR